jgi:uncharacterized membrane protein
MDQSSQKEENSLEDRLAKAANITTNYSVFLVTASIITTLALSINDTTNIVGAMVISPLLNPIFGMMFSAARKGPKPFVNLCIHSLMTFLYGTILAFITAWLIGLVFTVFSNTDCAEGEVFLCWPTLMSYRLGQWAYIIIAFIYGTSSGIASSIAYSEGVFGVVLGVMIAIALLPPICNSGLTLAYGLFGNIININGGISPEVRDNAFSSFGISLAVYAVSVLMIIVGGIIGLYVKRLLDWRRRKNPVLDISLLPT